MAQLALELGLQEVVHKKSYNWRLKMKKTILALSLLLPVITWADYDVYCQQTITCNAGTCEAIQKPFQITYNKGPLDGTYQFQEAESVDSACAYINWANRATIKTSVPYNKPEIYPDLQLPGNQWGDNGGGEIFCANNASTCPWIIHTFTS